MQRTECRVPFLLRALIVGLIFGAFTYVSAHFAFDDALIYARYISNALHGYGLVFNHGENVNALTSILDTWLQLGLSWVLGGRILLAQAILSGVFLLAAAVLAEWLVPLSGIIVAATPLFYLCSGMETSLFLLLVMGTIVAYEREAIQWLPTLCVLVVLTRFEGGILMAVITYRLWKRRQWPRAKAFLPPVLLFGIYFAFNLSFYHALLPQSATAKLGQGLSGYWGRWPTAFLRIPPWVYEPFGSAWIFLPLLLTFAAFAIPRTQPSRRNEVAVPFAVLLIAFYVLANIPAYHWYFAPLVYLGILYASTLIPSRNSALLSTGFLLLLGSWAALHMLHRLNHQDRRYVDAASWLMRNTPPGARIASVETGTIGWHCDRYIIDIVGLTTPQNARYTMHRDFSSWIRANPDFVVVHPATAFPWEKVALESPDYELLPMSFGDVKIMRRKP